MSYSRLLGAKREDEAECEASRDTDEDQQEPPGWARRDGHCGYWIRGWKCSYCGIVEEGWIGIVFVENKEMPLRHLGLRGSINSGQ